MKDIYQGAVTRIKTSVGITSDIRVDYVDRGVLHGDTLFPFLFNCFTEPLTRWLHVGGRGYSLDCMSKADDKAQMNSFRNAIHKHHQQHGAADGQGGAVFRVGKFEAQH